MAGLVKQANGLPRFMMDCGWWRNGRRWRRPTLAELGLHHAGVSHANEHGTDGVLPGPSAEDLAIALSLPVAEVRKALPKLLAREAWIGRADGDYEIVGFLEHNPSRREVAADRRRRQVASEIANHQRHHVKKNITDPDCVYCSDSESEPQSESDSQADSDVPPQADSNKEVSNGRKEVRKDSPPPPTVTSTAAAPGHEEEPPRWARIEAEHRLSRRPPTEDPVFDPPGWLYDVARSVRLAKGAEVDALRRGAPDLTDEEIHARLFGPQSTLDELTERLRKIEEQGA